MFTYEFICAQSCIPNPQCALQMPMMHRVSVFRDDVIFIIYMFQRRYYPVDRNRPAEGFDSEDGADGPGGAALEPGNAEHDGSHPTTKLD